VHVYPILLCNVVNFTSIVHCSLSKNFKYGRLVVDDDQCTSLGTIARHATIGQSLLSINQWARSTIATCRPSWRAPAACLSRPPSRVADTPQIRLYDPNDDAIVPEYDLTDVITPSVGRVGSLCRPRDSFPPADCLRCPLGNASRRPGSAAENSRREVRNRRLVTRKTAQRQPTFIQSHPIYTAAAAAAPHR